MLLNQLLPNSDLQYRDLYGAVTNRNLSEVKQLLSNQISVYQLAYQEYSGDKEIDDLVTLLEKAILLNEGEIIQEILKTTSLFSVWQERSLYRAIETASFVGDLAIIKLLLQAGGKNRKY